MLPRKRIPSTRNVLHRQLRHLLKPRKSTRKFAVDKPRRHWEASPVTVTGGIAQLVERFVRNEEARGSNPLTSTTAPQSDGQLTHDRVGKAVGKSQ
jgi:hypothetical protein